MLGKKVEVAVTTNKGNVRVRNDDNYLIKNSYMEPTKENSSFRMKLNPPTMVAVCDGMGGGNYGKEAALLAIQQLQLFSNNFEQYRVTKEMVNHMICSLNDRIFETFHKDSKAGTTIALLYLGETIIAANVGDTRIYRYQNNRLGLISQDHNQAQEVKNLFDQGITLGNNRARSHILTQYLGMSKKEILIEPYMKQMDYEDSMIFMICSDGLYEVLEEEVMEDILHRKLKKNLKSATNALVKQALKYKGKDNITSMLIKVEG